MLEPIPADIGLGVGYTLDRSPVNHGLFMLTFTHTGNLESEMNLTCSLWASDVNVLLDLSLM